MVLWSGSAQHEELLKGGDTRKVRATALTGAVKAVEPKCRDPKTKHPPEKLIPTNGNYPTVLQLQLDKMSGSPRQPPAQTDFLQQTSAGHPPALLECSQVRGLTTSPAIHSTHRVESQPPMCKSQEMTTRQKQSMPVSLKAFAPPGHRLKP